MTIQHRSPLPLRTLAALLVASCFGAAQAVPSTPLVVNGQATFAQNGNVFSITNTPNTVINWHSFSVNAGEVTRFIQQSGDSAVLNRIVGQDPSQIMGALQSNGHVFLINPNGILFGRDSRVDVNGLTASTLGMTDADFLSGKKQFASGTGQAGAIVNQGAISTPSGGRVFLIASSVDNAGIITSPQGQVVLAAGHSVQLVDSGNPSLHVVVSAPADQAVNLGQIIAQGGKVGIYGALVSQRGVVNADSAQVGANGKIVLRASGDAMLDAGSVTTATGAGRGGDVSVEGVRVGMLGNARIDASGAAGGGSVLLGGSYQGNNPLVINAQQTLMGKDATIRADAIDSGNGGTVVVRSDESTRAIGAISARGGSAAGNGGLVETSGKTLDVNGIGIQAGALNGANGAWLLDPFDIEVADVPVAALGEVDQFLNPGARVLLGASTISSVAPGTNVLLQARHDVTFSHAINPMLGSSGSLTVHAGNSIFINAGIDTNGGSVKMTANHPAYASKTGAIFVGAAGSLNTGGGHVSLDAFQVALGGPVNTRGGAAHPADGNMTINAASQVRFEQNIATGNGHLTVTGSDIAFDGAGTTAASGFMLFNNVGGTFTLGPNWTLASSQSINLFADSMSLLGTVGPGPTVQPVVNLMTYTAGKPIDIVGGAGGPGLALDPAALQRFDAASINIGNPGYTGNISVLSAYSGGKTSQLTLNTQGNIAINAPVMLPSGVDSALTLRLAGNDHKSSITTAPDSAGPAQVAGGRLGADHIELQANNMSLGAPIRAGGAAGNGDVMLMPHMATGRIAIGAGAVDGVDMLGLLDTELQLITAGELGIGGNDGQMGGLTVGAAGMDFTSILADDGRLMLQGGMGELTVNGNLIMPGWLFLEGRHLQTAKGASVKAQGMRLQSHFGLGTDLAPFVTQTNHLSVSNESAGGFAPINIANTGELNIESIHQSGAGNQGSITVANAGGMTLHEIKPEAMPGPSIFTGGKGNITLKTMSPLTIKGDIGTQSGAIMLEAGNGGVLTIGPAAQVTSVAGNIGLTGGALVNDGALVTSLGNIHISAPGVSGAGKFSAPAGAVTGLPVKVPGIGDCLVNGALPGCTAVLKAALDACVVTPTGANCLALLPSLAVCAGAPETYGCSIVLPSLKVCIATPNAMGCSVVLPTLTACTAKPATKGCAVVLPTLAQCTDSPTLQGCTAVLPSLSTCAADPDVSGCRVVLLPVTATPDSKLEKALKTTLDVLDKSGDDILIADRGDKKVKKDDSASAGAEIQPGEKRHDIAKNYCN